MSEHREDGSNIPSSKLLDHEVETANEKQATLSRVTLEIENILLRENMTMGDFLEIVSLFTHRANQVFSLSTIKSIKEKYGN